MHLIVPLVVSYLNRDVLKGLTFTDGYVHLFQVYLTIAYLIR